MKAKLFVLIIIVVMPSNAALALCQGTPVNLVTELCWDCFFPIIVGEIMPVGESEGSTCQPQIYATSFVCACNAPAPYFFTYGMGISFWEPSRMLEVVTEPYCFPSVGGSIGSAMNSGHQAGPESNSAFMHVHSIVVPAYMLLEDVVEPSCTVQEDFDIEYITEIDPLWGIDELSLFMSPEAVLFANPLAQFACVVDGLSANTQSCAMNEMPWCAGSWGSVYPITGNVSSSDFLEAQTLAISKLHYKMTSLGLVDDYAMSGCDPEKPLYWQKDHYRLQMAKPKKDSTCRAIGTSGTLWQTGKDIPFRIDNSVYFLWRAHGCCSVELRQKYLF